MTSAEANARVEELIDRVVYYTGLDAAKAQDSDDLNDQLERVMHCTLILTNGHIVSGVAFARSLDNMNYAVGKAAARERAIAQVRDLVEFEARG